MMKTKCKSLGKMEYPLFGISHFDGSRNRVQISVKAECKKVVIETSVGGAARQLVELARNITGMQREYALTEWRLYLQMKIQSGYVATDGQE